MKISLSHQKNSSLHKLCSWTFLINNLWFLAWPLVYMYNMIFVRYAYVFHINCFLLIEYRLERKTVKRKRVFANLKVLGTVLEQLSEEIPDEVVFMLSWHSYYYKLPFPWFCLLLWIIFFRELCCFSCYIVDLQFWEICLFCQYFFTSL